MSYHRFFLDIEPEFNDDGRTRLPLTAEDAHHAVHVLRLKTGESVDVVAPSRTVWRVEVENVDGRGVEVRAVEQLAMAHDCRLPQITLFQGVAKGEKMNAIVRAAVEIGAARIVPVMTSRSVVKLDAKKVHDKGERWRRIARSAAQQSRRDVVPDVLDPLDFTDAIELIAGHDGIFTLWEECESPLLSVAARDALAATPDKRRGGACDQIAAVIGPEGGLSASEVDALEAAGATTVTLGASVLRTETAAVVTLGILTAIARETRERS